MRHFGRNCAHLFYRCAHLFPIYQKLLKWSYRLYLHPVKCWVFNFFKKVRFRPAQFVGDIQTFTIFEKLHVFIIKKKTIGFSIKIHLGYLETHLFTTLGGGVKHGIQISIEITKFQIPTFFWFWWITTLHNFWKTGESRNSMFSKKQKVETSKIGFSIKIQLGYLETHLFRTLGGGVKHGITVWTEMTKFQISNSFFFAFITTLRNLLTC